MLTLSEFKNEYRGVCSDTWGDALDAWFECAGHLYKRGLKIPSNWGYHPGATNDGTEPDTYWYELFLDCTDDQLIVIGLFLFRYCEYLKFKGVDY